MSTAPAPLAGLNSADQQPRRPSAAEALASGGSQLERRLVVALSGGMLLLVSWLGRSLFDFAENVTQIPAAIGAIIVATPLFTGAVRELREGRPSGNALASLWSHKRLREAVFAPTTARELRINGKCVVPEWRRSGKFVVVPTVAGSRGCPEHCP